ncbi:MAG: ECF transporter S component [Ruminiclostridium sp.]|nr:ECF transporter S component [Ruminococcus sp.]MBR1833263.1 ECF transporter S component [Ruminiclostridium sp.]
MSTNSVAENTAVKKMDIKKLCVLALFTALGYICVFVFRFKIQFLTLEFKDTFIVLAGFVYGPFAALGVSFAESLLEMLTLSDTGFWGALMNFCGSAAFACTASLIYKYNKSYVGAIIGLIASVFSMTAVMILMNLLITPIYMHAPVKTVIGMIVPLLLPFNILKSLLNAGYAFILYKPIVSALKSVHALPHGMDNGFKLNKRSVVGMLIAAVIIIASIAVVISLFGGTFEVVKQAG